MYRRALRTLGEEVEAVRRVVDAVRLELVATTTFPSGVVRYCYRPAPADTPSTG